MLNEFHYLYSKRFVDHKGPNISLPYGGSPKYLLNRINKQIEKASKEKIAELELAQEMVAFHPTELLRISEELENQRAELNTREEEWLEITDQLGD